MGIMFHAIQKKGYVIIAQKYLFHQVWAAPSGDCRGGRWSPQAIPVRRPTNRHCLAWNSNIGKFPWWENRSRKKKLIGSSEINPKIVNCLFGCIVLVDAHIKICTIWLIKIYSFSFGELAGGAENSPLVLVDAWPLQFVWHCRWPRLGNWWAREAQLTESSHISRWGKVDTF